MLRRFLEWWRGKEDDDDFLASAPPVPDDFECPDTQPTAPGLLDSLTDKRLSRGPSAIVWVVFLWGLTRNRR